MRDITNALGFETTNANVSKDLDVECCLLDMSDRCFHMNVSLEIQYPFPEFIYVKFNDLLSKFKYLNPQEFPGEIPAERYIYSSDVAGFVKLNTFKTTKLYIVLDSRNEEEVNTGDIYVYFKGVRYELGYEYASVELYITEKIDTLIIDEFIPSFCHYIQSYNRQPVNAWVVIESQRYDFGIGVWYVPEDGTSHCPKTVVINTPENIRLPSINNFISGLWNEIRSVYLLSVELVQYNGQNPHISFSFNPALEKIRFGKSFDTSKINQLDCLFYNCGSLKTLDLSNFNTFSATKIEKMFWVCSSLEFLDISSFDLTNVKNADSMFRDCDKLTKILMTDETFEKIKDELPGGNSVWEKTGHNEYSKKQI